MGVLLSSLRNSLSRFPSDSASSIHTIYAYLTGLLLALVQLKYQALNTSPFSDHPALMILFLIAITVYAMALFVLGSHHQIKTMMIWVCHISGSLACEMLLLVLVSPLWSFIINLSSLLLLLTFLLFYHFFFQPSSELGQVTQGTDPAATVPNP
ncbi:hypothetical protein K1719_038919 [Acacia pycnantha]|nr:hypothetical protein K1719_038919 [Acacia pycnantha]